MMPRETKSVRLVSPGPQAWRSGGLHASQDEPYIRGLRVNRAEWIVENGPFEFVDDEEAEPEPTIEDQMADVLDDGTLSELDDELEKGTFDNHLDRVTEFEENHQDRDGAYDRIETRRAQLELMGESE